MNSHGAAIVRWWMNILEVCSVSSYFDVKAVSNDRGTVHHILEVTVAFIALIGETWFH